MRAPPKEVLDQVREELRVARTAERNMAERNATLFINPLDSRRQLHRNYGDNSAISRQRYGEQTLAAAVDGTGIQDTVFVLLSVVLAMIWSQVTLAIEMDATSFCIICVCRRTI